MAAENQNRRKIWNRLEKNSEKRGVTSLFVQNGRRIFQIWIWIRIQDSIVNPGMHYGPNYLLFVET